MTFNDAYWLALAQDMVRFRSGAIRGERIEENYPELKIEVSTIRTEPLVQILYITIPYECPLKMVAKLYEAFEGRHEDVNNVSYNYRVAYQPEWEQLPQEGDMEYICARKEPVNFSISSTRYLGLKSDLLISRCVKHGSCGDEDGYDVEADTWLQMEIMKDGTIVRSWYIQD